MFQYELKQKLNRALQWQLEKTRLFEIRLVDSKGLAEKKEPTAKRLIDLVATNHHYWLKHFVESLFVYGSAFFYKQRSPLLNDFSIEGLVPLPATDCTIMLNSAGIVQKIDCASAQPLVQFDGFFDQQGTIDASRCVFYIESNPYGLDASMSFSPVSRVLNTFEKRTFCAADMVDDVIMQNTGVHPYFISQDWSVNHSEIDVSPLIYNGLEFIVAPLVSKFVGMLNRHINFYGDFHFDFEYKGKEG